MTLVIARTQTPTTTLQSLDLIQRKPSAVVDLVIASGTRFRITVVICTDLSGKEPHRQVSMSSVVTSVSLSREIVSTLAWNASDVGSIQTLATIFPISITPMTLRIGFDLKSDR